ncbi:hypothetical protein N7G274_006671 [Stereocaulon virgatum]|uniref:Uncharacterized protein n=1 Tax=Stereocaulon virgatum TaxID=373712 RepID=A0ABR4A468_9LECA
MASPPSSSYSSSQESFTSNYDLDNPISAISSYSRLLHQYTKRQMELATRSSNRRSDPSGVSHHLSSDESVESVDSVEQS